MAMRQIRISATTNSEQQHGAADQAELLADRGEREVGPHDRDVAAVGERALQPSLAPDPAGADGPDRVVGPGTIEFSPVVLAEEDPEPLGLVVVDEAARRTRPRPWRPTGT